jgi:hypothetical protein
MYIPNIGSIGRVIGLHCSPFMRRTVFIATAFALHLLIGNLCFNGMPFAHAPDATPDGPLFSRDITQCPLINKSLASDLTDPIVEEQESPCATGNCFKVPHAPTICTAYAAGEYVVSAIPDTTINITEYPLHVSLLPFTDDRPPPLIGVTTIVLRT